MKTRKLLAILFTFALVLSLLPTISLPASADSQIICKHEHEAECWDVPDGHVCAAEAGCIPIYPDKPEAHHHSEDDCYDPDGEVTCGLEDGDSEPDTDAEPIGWICGAAELICAHKDCVYDEICLGTKSDPINNPGPLRGAAGAGVHYAADEIELKNAVAGAANGDTIDLTADIQLTAPLDIPSGKSITLTSDTGTRKLVGAKETSHRTTGTVIRVMGRLSIGTPGQDDGIIVTHKAGEKGTVTATYSASGRPGSFNKTVTVISNAGEERLIIKGVVTPKVPKVEDQYPFDFSGLRIKTQNVYLNNVEYPSVKNGSIEVINTTADPVAITFKDVPAFITVTPLTLPANEKGTIELTFDSKAAKDWGMISPSFFMVLNNKVIDDKKIGVYANIVEDFAALTPEQKTNAPVINVGGTITLGELKANKKNNVKFEVGNEGKSDLIFRKGSSDNEAIKVSIPSGAIKPNKKNDIKLEINTANLNPGKFSSHLTFITNDPNRSVISVQVEGEVVK